MCKVCLTQNFISHVLQNICIASREQINDKNTSQLASTFKAYNIMDNHQARDKQDSQTRWRILHPQAGSPLAEQLIDYIQFKDSICSYGISILIKQMTGG